jgi:hypothetical protein
MIAKLRAHKRRAVLTLRNRAKTGSQYKKNSVSTNRSTCPACGRRAIHPIDAQCDGDKYNIAGEVFGHPFGAPVVWLTPLRPAKLSTIPTYAMHLSRAMCPTAWYVHTCGFAYAMGLDPFAAYSRLDAYQGHS